MHAFNYDNAFSFVHFYVFIMHKQRIILHFYAFNAKRRLTSKLLRAIIFKKRR